MPRKPLHDLPYLVHSNRELGLMLKGVKPLATFIDARHRFPEGVLRYLRHFDRHVAQGRLVRQDRVIPDPDGSGADLHMILFALPHEAWRIDAMIALKESLFSGRRWSPQQEREEGQLLGYEEWQIDMWLKSFKTPSAD